MGSFEYDQYKVIPRMSYAMDRAPTNLQLTGKDIRPNSSDQGRLGNKFRRLVCACSTPLKIVLIVRITMIRKLTGTTIH